MLPCQILAEKTRFTMVVWASLYVLCYLSVPLYVNFKGSYFISLLIIFICYTINGHKPVRSLSIKYKYNYSRLHLWFYSRNELFFANVKYDNEQMFMYRKWHFCFVTILTITKLEMRMSETVNYIRSKYVKQAKWVAKTTGFTIFTSFYKRTCSFHSHILLQTFFRTI
jgi:hypothetical protein